MSYEKKNTDAPKLIELLRQRFTGSDGKLIRGAKSRIAEHLGVSYASVSQWLTLGRACNHRHHYNIAMLILSNQQFSARKPGPRSTISTCEPSDSPRQMTVFEK